MEGARGRKKTNRVVRHGFLGSHMLTGGAAGGYRSQKGEERGGTHQEETGGRLEPSCVDQYTVYCSWR